MEPRKIIKFGTSFVVTLPFEWVKQNNLVKGDILNLAENKDSILLTTNKIKEEKQAEIEIDNKIPKLFNRELISYYLKNFKTIKITGENIIEKIEDIRIIKEKLSSLEITEIQKNSITLKDLTSPSELDIKRIITEIIEMEKIIFDELIKEENGGKHFLITNLDKNVNKLRFLGYKAINYNLDSWTDANEIKNEIYYWRIISSFETIGDILKRVARYLKDVNPEQNHFVNSILNELKHYFEFITDLFNPKVPLENNLKIYLDKKQSLLLEFESLRVNFENNLNLFLVITQLLKDIVGKLDDVVLSIIDLNCRDMKR